MAIRGRWPLQYPSFWGKWTRCPVNADTRIEGIDHAGDEESYTLMGCWVCHGGLKMGHASPVREADRQLAKSGLQL